MNALLLNFNPVAFEIGSIEVRWYGIILTSAMILGLFMIILMGKKKGIESDAALELFLWLIPLAVVFARIIYVLANNEDGDYFPINSWDDFVHCIAIWDGGITIYGGLFGGVIGAIIFCRKHKFSLGVVLDILVPVMLICQSLGRWGNFFNQEAFGQAVTNEKLWTLPFAVYIDDLHALIAKADGAGWYQATFLYEGVFNFIGAFLMFYLWRKNKVDGALVAPYLVWYCVIRLILDHLRVDGLMITKVACGVVIPLGIVFGILYYKWGLKRLDHKKAALDVQEMLLYSE